MHVKSSFFSVESSYLAESDSVLIFAMMNRNERDLYYPTWGYVGMLENSPLSSTKSRRNRDIWRVFKLQDGSQDYTEEHALLNVPKNQHLSYIACKSKDHACSL